MILEVPQVDHDQLMIDWRQQYSGVPPGFSSILYVVP